MTNIQKMSRITKAALATVLAVGAMSAAQAAQYQFYNGSTLYATMVTSGGTTFTLSVASGINSAAFIDYLNLAGPGGTFTNLTNSSITTASGTYNAGGFTDQGSTYNWKIDFPNPNGASRFTAGETASWSITVTDPNAWNFNLLHVNAFDGVNSIKLSGCEVVTGSTNCSPPVVNVPEPGTLALLGAALVAGSVARRKLRPVAMA